jgi:hypothetical protein
MFGGRCPSLAPRGFNVVGPDRRGFAAGARFRPRNTATLLVLRALFWGIKIIPMGLALKCTDCGAASVSAMFYRGPEAHVCRVCRGPLELADPTRDRRVGGDRRNRGGGVQGWAEWRSGEERRWGLSTPGTLSRTAA